MNKIIIILMLLPLAFCFEAKALDNPELKMTATIKDYIVSKYPSWLKEEINLNFKYAETTFGELAKLPKTAKFRVLEVYPEFKPVGNAVFPIEVLSGDLPQKVFIRAKVEVVKNILAAAKRIKKGKILEASDFKVDARDVALLPQKYFMDTAALIGKEAKISIPANSTIFEWMIGDLPAIRRGAEVSIVVSGQGLSVRTRGQALEDGYLGADIKVKRMDAKKQISGRVISPSEVEVRL